MQENTNFEKHARQNAVAMETANYFVQDDINNAYSAGSDRYEATVKELTSAREIPRKSGSLENRSWCAIKAISVLAIVA